MKNIYQLIRLQSRAERRARGSMRKLMQKPSKNPHAKPWKDGLKPGERKTVNVNFHRGRLNACAVTALQVGRVALQRRIGLPGVRDARPLKQQRALGLIPPVSA